MEEVYHTDLIPLPPPPKKIPADVDRNKYCRYHRNYSHDTDDCIILKAKIEELIQQGHLGEYVQGNNTRRQSYERQPYIRRGFYGGRGRGGRFGGNDRGDGQNPSTEENQQRTNTENTQNDEGPRGVLNTIAGGFAGGGVTRSARKRYLRNCFSVNAVAIKPSLNIPPITFTEEDYVAIDPNQDDLMVITIELANFTVKRKLVDQGSSADILYYSTFKKLGIPGTSIKGLSTTLVGFSGERVETLGYVELLTTIGSGELSRTITVKYVIIDAKASYNILLGRPSLNDLEAVVSTPHLAMKFPSTSGRIVTVKADQKMARQCYADSLKVGNAIKMEEVKKGEHGGRECASVSSVELDSCMDMKDLHTKPIEDSIKFQIGKLPEQCTRLDSQLER